MRTRIIRCFGVRRGGACDSKSFGFGMDDDEDDVKGEGEEVKLEVVVVLESVGSVTRLDSWWCPLPDVSLLLLISLLCLDNCKGKVLVNDKPIFSKQL